MSHGNLEPLIAPAITPLLMRAQSEWEAGQLDAMERTLAGALAAAPRDPRAVRMAGMVARRRGDFARAVDCFRQVVTVWPDDPFLIGGLGVSLFSLGEIEEATGYFRRNCELEPDSPAAWFNLGEALWQQAYVEEAVVALQRAVALEPAHLDARLSLGRAQASLGRVEAAVSEFREVVRRDPVNADGWYRLSVSATRFDTADTTQLQRAFERPGLPPRDHYLLGYAFAKALENRGDYAKAFEILRLANAAQRATLDVTWGVAEERAFVSSIRDAFANPVAQVANANTGAEAILIVGMPRSGTTLVEQILASHPDVGGANEIKDLPLVLDAETRRRGSAFPLWVRAATAADWQRLGDEYLARTARWHGSKPRFTDKNLMNWHYVGAALAMLPAARVIIVRRDPVETCLACYRHCFSEDAGFSCDLDDVADYYAEFWRLTRFWLEKYPEHVFDLQYEALTADSEYVIRRLLDFCGLPFAPACLEFHKTARAVLTPSAAQVREPLRHDTARSARYGHALDHLRQRLHDAGVFPEA